MKILFLVVALFYLFFMGNIAFSQSITEINYGFQGDLSAGIINAKASGSFDLDFINSASASSNFLFVETGQKTDGFIAIDN